MMFKTQSGALYEIQGKRARRYGSNAPNYAVQEGEWKRFIYVSKIAIGSRVMFVWEGAKSTITSPVSEIMPSQMPAYEERVKHD